MERSSQQRDPAKGSLLQPLANARLLLWGNQLPGLLDSPRLGWVVAEAMVRQLRPISSRDNAPGIDTGDESAEGILTRAAVMPAASTPGLQRPWDWLAKAIPWSTAGLRPLLDNGQPMQAPCSGLIWLGDLSELSNPAQLPSPSRGQLAGLTVVGFGAPYGAGGAGLRSQPLLGERLLAAIKPNRVIVLQPSETLLLLAQRYGTSAAELRKLNPELETWAAESPLPAGSWLLIPRWRIQPGGDGSRPLTPSSFFTPQALANYLQVPLSTIESWAATGYGPTPVTFGELTRYPVEAVEAWVAQQLASSL